MAAKKRGLGRGLDALLGNGGGKSTASADGTLRKLPIEAVTRGRYQPRREIDGDALKELAESISAQGLVQPIVVRAMVGGRYEIIAGERRWRAAQLAGLHEVPALVREVTDQAAMAMALIENIQREDLNPLDEALAFKRLQDEFELTHQQVAAAVGRSRAAVSNLIRLLDLSEEIQTLLQHGKLEMGHARALLPLSRNLQKEAAEHVVLHGLSVRETERLVRNLLQNAEPGADAKNKTKKKVSDPNIRELQDSLSARLGAKVAIQHSTTGQGRLVIHYHSVAELDGILEHLK